jgi:hypothetical protein
MRYSSRWNRAFGDVIDDVQTATDADTVAGINALKFFWQAAGPLNPQMPADFGAFLQGLKAALVPTTLQNRWPGYVGPLYPNNPDAVFKQKVAGIGLMVNSGGTSSAGFFSTLFNSASDVTPMTAAQVQSAMSALAQQGSGKIPADFNSFTAVLTNSATQVNFLDALWFTATASAANVVQGAQAAGNAVIATGEGALNALNIFAQYESYFIFGGVAIAGLVAYKLYLKPMSKRMGLATNPRRRARRARRAKHRR